MPEGSTSENTGRAYRYTAVEATTERRVRINLRGCRVDRAYAAAQRGEMFRPGGRHRVCSGSRAMPSSLGFIAVLISVLGCGTVTRSLEQTSWLRAAIECRYEPLAVIDRTATSGGWRGQVTLERHDGTRWAPLDGVRFEALASDDHFAAVMPRVDRGTESAYRLFTRDGADVPLWCGETNPAAELRLSPAGEFVCVEIESPNERARARVIAYDASGRAVRWRAARLPIAPTSHRRVYTSFVGFAGREAVFVQQIGRDDARFEPSLVDPCTALALDRRGKWRRLGTIPAGFGVADQCVDARVWSAILQLDVVRGGELERMRQPRCPSPPSARPC